MKMQLRMGWVRYNDLRVTQLSQYMKMQLRMGWVIFLSASLLAIGSHGENFTDAALLLREGRSLMANSTESWLYPQLGRMQITEEPGFFNSRVCQETCKLSKEFCEAEDAFTAFRLLNKPPKGPMRSLTFEQLHFSASWLSSVWIPEYFFRTVLGKYNDNITPRVASIIHGAMWQAVYGAALEQNLGPGEMLDFGLRLCGEHPSFEMLWTCSHGIGHAASYFAISQDRPVDKPACAEFPTGVSDLSAMEVAERICVEYTDRGLAYSCAEGVWMTTAGSKLVMANSAVEKKMLNAEDPGARFEMCENAMFPAMCIYYVRKMSIEDEPGDANCKTPTIKDVCARYQTNPYLYRQCVYGVACADGRAIIPATNCGWNALDLMKRCEGFENEVLTSLCLDGLNYINAVKLGEKAEMVSGSYACEEQCGLWEASNDPKIRGMPCYARLICQKKQIVKSPGHYIPTMLLDMPREVSRRGRAYYKN